jgi:hypothetical protein
LKNVIETVGPYAGLIAVLGLAALSMLCFSMARDIRRLREWAGGAPERDTEVREVSELVAEERSEEIKVLGERERRRQERAGMPGSSFWDRLGSTGRVLAVVAAVVVLGAAAAFAGTTLLGDDGGNGNRGAGKGSNKRAGSEIPPGSIQVAVLNGTGGVETGIAAEYADALEKQGYDLGTVTDAPTTFSDSVVMHQSGEEAAAKQVGADVGIRRTSAVTSEVAGAADSMVTVVIGTDHGELPTGG